MKRQMLVGLVAGSLFAFAGLAIAQNAPAQAGAAAPATEAAPMKKEAAKKEMHHKKWTHHKKVHHKMMKKEKTKAPSAHTK
jgi:hypothetical protein